MWWLWFTGLCYFTTEQCLAPQMQKIRKMNRTHEEGWKDRKKGGSLRGRGWLGQWVDSQCLCWSPAAAAAAKSLQSCPTLCDPIDGSPSDSSVPRILQERILEWVAIPFSNAGKWKVKVKSLSCVRLLATPWTSAYQAPPFMGFSRQEYWSGLPLPSPMLKS